MNICPIANQAVIAFSSIAQWKVDPLVQLIMHTYEVGKQGYYLGMGFKGAFVEVIQEGDLLLHFKQTWMTVAEKLHRLCLRVVSSALLAFSGAGGLLAEGAFYAVPAARIFRGTLQFCGRTLFIFSNIFLLKIQIDRFYEGRELLLTGGPEAKARGYAMMVSAVLGITSALSYILSGALFLFGGSAALALVIGGVASALSILQFFIDLFL